MPPCIRRPRDFSPYRAGDTVCPDKQLHVYRGRNAEIQPLKLSKFGILATNLPLGTTRLHNF